MWIFEVFGTIIAIGFFLFMLVFLVATGLFVFLIILGIPISLLLAV